MEKIEWREAIPGYDLQMETQPFRYFGKYRLLKLSDSQSTNYRVYSVNLEGIFDTEEEASAFVSKEQARIEAQRREFEQRYLNRKTTKREQK